MAGILNKGITLSYKSGESFKVLTNLQQIPDLGGTDDSIEVTTFDDAAHMYIKGLKDYGDSLTFQFLYEKAQFDELAALSGELSWKVTLPDSTECSFDGECGVVLIGQGTNEALQYNLDIKPTSEMIWA